MTIRRALLLIGLLWIGAGRAAAQPAWPAEFPPRPLPARDVKFPAYEIRTLPNGLQVVAVLHHEQPVVSMRMILRTGSALDPKGKLGLAYLTASLLTQGTTTRSARELNDEIDFIGGEMDAGAGSDLTFINTVVMKDSFATGLAMLSDMARHPAFSQEEIDRQRQQMLSGLQVSLDDPSFIADAVFNRLVYGFHPYGLPETGTPETLATLTRDDLVAYHRRNFAANNAILAIVGDVTTEEAFDGVSRVFGDWERRDIPASKPSAPPNPARRLIIVNKPDAVQTEVRVGQLGVRRNISDYMPLNLAIRILGGEGANRLHQILRTERGLTYGAEASMHTLRDSGDFVAETSTRSDATGEVLRLIIEQVQRLQQQRVNDRELSDAKAYLTGSFPLTIETPDAIATQVLNVLFFGLPIEELQSFRDRVNAVNSVDIERVARYYLMPDRLSIVLVGNAAAFSPQLRGLGFGNIETIDMDSLDLTASDFKRSRPRVGAGGAGLGGPGAARAAGPALNYQQTSSTAVERDSSGARTLLETMIQAKGGLEVLRGVKSISATTRSQMPTPAGTDVAEVATYLQYPNHVRVETRMNGTQIVQVYDGTHGWISNGQETREVPSEAVRELETGLRRDTMTLLLAAYDGSVRARLLPDTKDDAGRRFKVLELSALTLEPIVLWVDPETNLVARQTYLAGGQGQPIIEERFDDYKMIDGVEVALLATIRSGGQPVLERRVIEIKINQPLDPKLFTRPPS